jgi:hypothetical protein
LIYRFEKAYFAVGKKEESTSDLTKAVEKPVPAKSVMPHNIGRNFGLAGKILEFLRPLRLYCEWGNIF